MIVYRALTREILQTGAAVTLVVLSIFLVVRFVGFLRAAVVGHIPVDSVLVLMMLKLVTNMDEMLPLMLYLAILLVMERWSRDNELVVLAACGIGITRLLKPVMLLAGATAVLVAVFSLYLSPLSVRVSKQIKHDFQTRSEISRVVPGVFMETRQGNGVYFVESFDNDANEYHDIFVYNSSFENDGLVVAETGYREVDDVTGDTFLVLENGTRYEGVPGYPDYRSIEFEKYAIRLDRPAPEGPAIPVNGWPTPQLMQSNHAAVRTELHWRLASPIIVPVLAIFALAFSSAEPRRGRLKLMIAAFVVYFLYSNILGFSVGLMNKERLPPGIALWVVHGFFLASGLYLLKVRSLGSAGRKRRLVFAPFRSS